MLCKLLFLRTVPRIKLTKHINKVTTGFLFITCVMATHYGANLFRKNLSFFFGFLFLGILFGMPIWLSFIFQNCSDSVFISSKTSLPNFLSLILFTLLRSRYLHSECPWTLREQVVSLILSANPALNHWCWLSAGVECRFSAWRNCSNSRSMLISLHTTHIYPHLLPLCYNCEWNCLN